MLLGERFREGYPSNTNNPYSNPKQPELHPSYSNTHANDVGAHAYYSSSGVTRAVRDCYSGYSCYSDSLLENDRNAHKDHAVRITL